MNEITDLSIRDFSLQHGYLYRILLRSLDENSSWKILVESLRSCRVFLSDDALHRMKVSPNPSMVLLDELNIRCATVHHLRFLLRTSKLLNSLALISDPEPLKIVKQPGREDQLLTTDEGAKLTIECIAEGLPPPLYQWYFGNLEMCNQTNPVLTISKFGEEDRGEYYCVVSHVINDETISMESNHVFADFTPVVPQFSKDLPEQIIVSVGRQFAINVEVVAWPPPTYVWLKNNVVLEGNDSDTLEFESVQPEHEGDYKCLIRNLAGELASSTCTIHVIMSPEQVLPGNAASHKVALLIGNSAYASAGTLYTPSEDVALIAQKLRQLNFYVIALQNLTSVEMKSAIRWFYNNLPVNAYAFFYYVGHGFMTSSKYKYMMPVDITESYQLSDCYPDEKLIKRIMKTKIKLFFMVLDMCSKIPERFNQKVSRGEERTYRYTRNPEIALIQLNSTSDHMKAYESSDNTQKNALYAQCLATFLTKDYPYPASYIATLVQEEFNRCLKKKFQKPSMVSDDVERLSLTDPVPLYDEDTDFDVEMMSWNALNEKEVLKFQEINLITYVSLSFYKGCFQNALQLVFPVELNRWFISAEINQQNLNNYEWSRTEADEMVLTIFDLQKAKSSICITINLNDKRYSNSTLSYVLVDNCMIDLGYLGIVDKKLGISGE